MSEIQDDKAQYVVPFVLERLFAHRKRYSKGVSPPPPFFIGLNGIQGAGKSVLVSILHSTLSSAPYNLPTVVFSLDDLYLKHADQQELARSHPHNPLLQRRGQPSTHDVPLALSVFESLRAGRRTKIPQYNKAAFSGQGDRVPESEWEEVNADPSQLISVVLFEGWSVGFRPIAPTLLKSKHAAAVAELHTPGSHYVGRLGHETLQSVTDINNALQQYDRITDALDALVHIDATDTQFVYKWRLQQEHGLRESKGAGMTDEQVREFVDGYYPAYELYTEALRKGVFWRPGEDSREWQGRQLRLVVDKDRKVQEVVKI